LPLSLKLSKSRFWFSYGETKLGQGRDAVKSIKDNPELADELEVKIKARIKELARLNKKRVGHGQLFLHFIFCKHRFFLFD
jgi:hypothetical protein